jgi:hypothetical protein
LLRRCRSDNITGGDAWLAQLSAQCALRAPLFSPEAERAALHQLVHDLNKA